MKKISIFFIIILAVFCSSCNIQKIEYKKYKDKSQRKVILIDTKNRNIEDLKLLGQQLNNENSSLSFAWVCVFDNASAADMLGSETEWNEEEEKFYNNHFVAVYNKNGTKTNRFLIKLTNTEGGELEINF